MKKLRKNKLIGCPICNSNKAITILNLDCGNLDNSMLYQFVNINVCAKCGHIYNCLSVDEIEGLMKYYSKEYAPLNLSSTDKLGDRPGSNNPFTLKRYAQLYNLICPYVNKDSKILDIGCAMGGFLDYLYHQGLSNLYGIDIVEDYVSQAKKKDKYNIKIGGAESIPFEDKSFDLLVMDQLLEHSVNSSQAFKEAKRVLVNDGLLCVGVPDASRYDEIYFFDFFWFLMREHIQHFDLEHLKLLAAQEGFELVTYHRSETPMMSEKMILPNLSVVFRLTGKKGKLNFTKSCFEIKNEIERYIKNEFKKLNEKKRLINYLITSQKPLYFWGIGREFFYLYETLGAKNCNIIGLIDTNPYKQKKFSVGGKKIMDKSILENATSDSVLIISATAHTEQIKKTILEVNYRGKIIEV